MPYNAFLKLPLKESQYQYVDFARVHDYCIMGCHMGSGKTLIGIVTGLMNGGLTVICCPAFLKLNWLKEYEKFSKKEVRIIIVTGAIAHKVKTDDYDVIILNYAILGKCEHIFKGAKTVVFDEGHKLLNPKAARTKAAAKYIKLYAPKKMLLMTGTPNRGKNQQWYVPAKMCSMNPSGNSGLDMRKYYNTYWDFQLAFCNRTILNVGGREITQFTGAKNIPKLTKLLKGKLIVGKKPDLGLELNFKDVHVDYQTDDKDLQEAWEAYEAGNPIQEHIMSAKAMSALSKAKFTSQYVKNLVESGEGPVVLFTDHLDSLDALCDHLSGLRVAMINGSTPMEKRNKYVEAFEAGELDVLAATILALNTGVNLVKSCNMVMNDLNWIFHEDDQAYHRIFRIGQTRDCMVHNIIGSEVDKNINRNINRSEKISKLVMEAME